MDSISLKWLLSGLVLPPTGPLLVAMLGAWWCSRVRGGGRFGKALLWCGLVSAWLLSTSLVSGALLEWIEGSEVALDEVRLANELKSAGRPGAIVVLAGGISHNPREVPGPERPGELSLERLTHGAYLARASGLPLLLSGGQPPERALSEARAMARTLELGFGLRARWIEERSRDTADNALESARTLRKAGIHRVVLVTHAYHMRRAAAAFEAAGLQVLRAPMGFYGGVRIEGPASFFPSPMAIRGSWLASHEALGLLWYRLRGHIAR